MGRGRGRGTWRQDRLWTHPYQELFLLKKTGTISFRRLGDLPSLAPASSEAFRRPSVAHTKRRRPQPGRRNHGEETKRPIFRPSGAGQASLDRPVAATLADRLILGAPLGPAEKAFRAQLGVPIFEREESDYLPESGYGRPGLSCPLSKPAFARRHIESETLLKTCLGQFAVQ